MQALHFEWDNRKNKSNQQKHDVSFEEARSVFYDENAFEYYDFAHSHEEERFLLLGISARVRLLLVSYTYNAESGLIRIISARRATKNEAKEYKR
jgi:uncharacterized DUF497 family protein